MIKTKQGFWDFRKKIKNVHLSKNPDIYIYIFLMARSTYNLSGLWRIFFVCLFPKYLSFMCGEYVFYWHESWILYRHESPETLTSWWACMPPTDKRQHNIQHGSYFSTFWVYMYTSVHQKTVGNYETGCNKGQDSVWYISILYRVE